MVTKSHRILTRVLQKLENGLFFINSSVSFNQYKKINMKKIITFAATLLLLNCNNNGNKSAKTADDANSNATTNPATNEASGGSATAGSEITVTLTGGPNAGTYTATSAETTCSEGLTGDNSFGNQYSAKGKADNVLSSLQLIIDDKNAAKQGTDKFSVEVKFGKLLGGKSYSINTRDNSKEGSGTATLTESGSTKTVVIEGKTADGVGISATITCQHVMTANGVQ